PRRQAATRRTPKTNATPPQRKAAKPPRDELTFTNLDKIMFPEEGITKGDVVEFYRRIASRLLPHLRDRPATLERWPDGVHDGAEHFWQKNIPTSYPDWI